MSDNQVKPAEQVDDLNISGDKPGPTVVQDTQPENIVIHAQDHVPVVVDVEEPPPHKQDGVLSERKIVPIPLPVHRTSMWDRDFTKKDKVLTCAITDYMFDTDEKGRFAKYIFQLTYGDLKWEVRHRQSEMEGLVNGIRQIIPTVPPFKSVVQWFGDKYGKDIMEKKMVEYTDYFKPFIYIKALYSLSSFVKFFELDKYVPFLLHNLPQYEGGSSLRALVVRALQPLDNPDFAYLITHDRFEINRIEGAISNLLTGNNEGKNKLIVTKSTEKSVSVFQLLVRVGSPAYYDCAALLKNSARKQSTDSNQDKEVNTVLGPDREKKEKLPEALPAIPESQSPAAKPVKPTMSSNQDPLLTHYFTYAPIVSSSFKATVISSHYSAPFVGLGFDSGSVMLIKVDTSKFLVETQHTFIQAHSETVFGLVIDKDRNRLISIGKDNKIVIYDMSKGRSLSSVIIPGKKLQSHAYDYATQLLYLGNGGQSVYIVDMRAEEICVVNKITTELNGPIKSLMYLETNNLLVAFGSQDGGFKIFHSKDFRDPKSKLTTFLHVQLGLKETTKAFYWKERKEIWTADNFGYVQVFTGVDLDRQLVTSAKPTLPPADTPGNPVPGATPKPKKTTAEIKIPVGTRCKGCN